MNCPRCNQVLLEKDRDGVTVDVCPGCRGLWLDRGELEKLIARASAEIEALERPRAEPRPDPAARYEPRPAPPPYDPRASAPPYDPRTAPPPYDPRARWDDTPPHGYPRKKKKHWFDALDDIFD